MEHFKLRMITIPPRTPTVSTSLPAWDFESKEAALAAAAKAKTKLLMADMA
jgi:hypothetical protein